MARYLDQAEVKSFYDHFGAKQDRQGWYEDQALLALTRASGFGVANKVFEFGCGTGKFAAALFENELKGTCNYTGIDISSTMTALARKRLEHWKERVTVHTSAGDLDFTTYGSGYDRFVSTYVFDLLPPEQLHEALSAAHDMLQKGGLLCAAGLTTGNGALSRFTSFAWSAVHSIAPSVVGGCRPLQLKDFLNPDQWRMHHRETIVSAGLASEILVAEAL